MYVNSFQNYSKQHASSRPRSTMVTTRSTTVLRWSKSMNSWHKWHRIGMHTWRTNKWHWREPNSIHFHLWTTAPSTSCGFFDRLPQVANLKRLKSQPMPRAEHLQDHCANLWKYSSQKPRQSNQNAMVFVLAAQSWLISLFQKTGLKAWLFLVLMCVCVCVCFGSIRTNSHKHFGGYGACIFHDVKCINRGAHVEAPHY